MQNSKSIQQDFFTKALSNFYKSRKNVNYSKKRYFSIGTKLICLNFTSSILEYKLLPALEHLTTEIQQKPDLTVYLWDSKTTQTKMIESPWNVNDYDIHGKVKGFNDDRFSTAVSMVSGALSMIDLKENLAIWWIGDANSLPLNEIAEPLMAIFNWWFEYNGLHFMHAGSVGTTDGGALLLGIKGSGKSTLSIASLTSPLFYAGDDYCLISEDEMPQVFSIYNTGKLNLKSLELLKNIKIGNNFLTRYTDNKSIFFINKIYPEKMITSFPVKAVILPIVDGRGESILNHISPFEAIKVIGPNTLFQFSGNKQRAFLAVKNLVKQVPCYKLRIGECLVQAHELILNAI